MRHQQSIIFLMSCLVSSCFCVSRADTTVTTETTVHRTTSSSDLDTVDLPATGNYVVVDPITGLPHGRYDPIARQVDGRSLQSGYVIVDKPTGNLVATVDASGRVVDVSVAPASDVLLVSIDTRRRDLDRQISNALNRGQITAAQASELRAQLDRIAADEAAAREYGGTLTYRKAMVVAYDLNTLAQRLGSTAEFTPVISPQIVVVDKQLTMVDKITYRKLQLRRRIDDEYQAGRLSGNQVSRLNANLDRVSSLETRYRRHGELSNSKSRTIAMKLDQLEISLNNDVSIINEKRSKIGIRVN